MSGSVQDKLKLLAGAAKYDVSCASSGNKRANNGKGIGNTTPWGICHSFTEDGRCVSLLKVMLSNNCINDCAYCVSRKSNDMPRQSFTVAELVKLTIEFYRRNYIEGLFLSSGILKSADYTMEQMVAVVKELRLKERYNGYIHLKAIPGASEKLIRLAGLYADRLSVNIEIPTEANLKMLAPQKDYKSILQPMQAIKNEIVKSKEERKRFRNAPRFSSAGQSTQLIIGATPDSDYNILSLSSGLYQTQNLKRVYYSGYTPVNTTDKRLPTLTGPPMQREHRLYQADWLFRFYFFSMEEIVNKNQPNLDPDVDPKLGYALRNPHLFPIDVNKCSYEMLLRIPGVGPTSARKIINARKFRTLTFAHLKKIGVVLKRAQYFIECKELPLATINELKPDRVKQMLVAQDLMPKKIARQQVQQLKLF